MSDVIADVLSGHVTSLRMVTTMDAADIIALRNDPHINGNLSSTRPITLQQQVNWIEANNKRNDNYYWMIVSQDGKVTGTISLYEIADKGAEFGRYICLNPINSVEAELILLDFAFNKIGLERVYCRTVIENTKVWKQHSKLGFIDKGIEDNKDINRTLKVQEIRREQYLGNDYSSFANMLKRFA
jgi:RimJ/RimL family protein N-acetyltransferase